MTRVLNYKNGLWLGTKEYQRFVPAPQRGVDATSAGYHEEATGKNGGGYISQSFGRHQNYQYDWPRATHRQYANYMQGLRDGLYGRGVIHFTDPTTYETNVLPPHWANPGLTLGFEAPPLVFRQRPEVFEFGRSDRDNTPMNGATYRNLPTQFKIEDALYIPIPPGLSFTFGVRQIATTGAGVFVQPVRGVDGINPADRVLMPSGIDLQNPYGDLVTHQFFGSEFSGVYVWVGRNAGTSTASYASILDMIGKLLPEETTRVGAVNTSSNLFTNPSFEGTTGKVTRRTNPGLTEEQWATSGIPGTFFDGDTERSGAKRYEWVGTPGASASIEYTPTMVEMYRVTTPNTLPTGRLDPRVEPFDGDTVPTDSDWTCWWNSNGSASIGGVAVAGIATPTGCWAIQSQQWAREGMYSLRLIPSGTSNNSYVNLNITPAWVSGTRSVVAVSRLEQPQNPETVSDEARSIRVVGGGVVSKTNTPDAEVLRVTTEATNPGVIQLVNGAALGGGDIWFDLVTVVEGTYAGIPFSGDTLPRKDMAIQWTGAAHNSRSTLVYQKNKNWKDQFRDQPWYGGEGHSGVRFVGQPTITRDGLTNTAMSVTFKEVGSWELASRL